MILSSCDVLSKNDDTIWEVGVPCKRILTSNLKITRKFQNQHKQTVFFFFVFVFVFILFELTICFRICTKISVDNHLLRKEQTQHLVGGRGGGERHLDNGVGWGW